MNVAVLGCGNIGYECAVLFSNVEKIWILDIRKPDYMNMFLDEHANAQFVYMNAVSEDSIKAALVEIDSIDVLIVTVGTTTKATSVENYKDFKRVFEINYYGVVNPITQILSKGKLSKNAKVLIITSTSGHHAHKSLDPYAPSKWALENFSSALSSELSMEGKQVYIIRPSTIQNERSSDFKSENGIAASVVAEKIYNLVTSEKSSGWSYYLPSTKRVLHIAERVFPSLLDTAYRLKPYWQRKKLYAKFDKKTALITGASSGLGMELAYALVNEYERLYIVARSSDKLEALRGELKSVCDVQVITADVGTTEGMNKVVQVIEGERLDLLVNNAGIQMKKDVSELSLENSKRSMEVNYFAPVYLTSKLIATGNKPKRVVNILSTTAIAGRRTLSIYSATKAALWCFSRSLRRVYGDEMEVVEVLPATFESGLSCDGKGSHGLTSKDVAKKIIFGLHEHKERIVIPKLKGHLFMIGEAVAPESFRKKFR